MVFSLKDVDESTKKAQTTALQQELTELIAEYNQLLEEEDSYLANLSSAEKQKGIYALPDELYFKDLFYLHKISNLIWAAQTVSVEPELLSKLYNISFQEYDFVSIDALPDNDISKSLPGKVYLREDGTYVIHSFEGKISEGSTGIISNPLKNLEANLKDPVVKKKLLEVARNKGQILNPYKYDLEMRLQLFGIHRDASMFLQNYEFAEAVNQVYSVIVEEPKSETSLKAKPKTTKVKPSFPTELSLYEAQKLRNEVLNKKPLSIENYVKFSLAIADKVEAEAISDVNKAYKPLNAKINRHKHFIGLSYGKIEAIQSQLKQGFKEYKTKKFPKGQSDNNKNYFLNLDDKTSQKVVVRVEQRSNLGAEIALQYHEVSEFFTEDYATFILPVVTIGEDGTTETINHPVVISEFVSEGSLDSYAVKLQGSSEKQIAESACGFFIGLTKFCDQLLAAKHGYPDVKLANFLTDGINIKVSDRKTIVPLVLPDNKILAKDISTTMGYEAPEYSHCVTKDASGEYLACPSLKTTEIDLSLYMAYQLGMALKEFVLLSMGEIVKGEDVPRDLLADYLEDPGKELQNLSTLAAELTREKPKDRLSIKEFQTLLSKINLEPSKFFQELESVHSIEKLSNKENILTMMQMKVLSEPPSDEFLESFKKLPLNILSEPRVQPLIFPDKKVSAYLDKVSLAISTANFKAASFWRKVAYVFSFTLYDVPQVTTLHTLGEKFPKIDKTMELYLLLYLKANTLGMLPSGKQTEFLNEILKFKNLTAVPVVPNVEKKLEKELEKDQESKKSIILGTTVIADTAPVAEDAFKASYKPIYAQSADKKITPKDEEKAIDSYVKRGDI